MNQKRKKKIKSEINVKLKRLFTIHITSQVPFSLIDSIFLKSIRQHQQPSRKTDSVYKQVSQKKGDRNVRKDTQPHFY